MKPTSTPKLLQDDLSYAPIDLLLLPSELYELAIALPLPLLREDETTLQTLTNPSRQKAQLKIRFHEVYSLLSAQDEKLPTRKLTLEEITKSVCSPGLLLEWAANKNFLAYLITPQLDQSLLISELLYRGLTNLREVLDEAIHDDEGNPRTTLINSQLAIVKMLDARKNGAPIIKQESKIMTQNLHAMLPPSREATDTSNQLLLDEAQAQAMEREAGAYQILTSQDRALLARIEQLERGLIAPTTPPLL